MSHHHADGFHAVTCPSCFETFQVAGPAATECPAEWDYDCEVCCRPMVIAFTAGEDDEVFAEARGTDD